MFYAMPDTLLQVSLNTNKTGHNVLRYTWYIVESVVKHQKNWSPYSLLVFSTTFNSVSGITWWPVLLVFNETFNNVSGKTYNMVTSFIGV
jgi:hypothetical protein